MHALKDEKKHIDNAKKYDAQQDTSWWDEFFSNQQGFIGNWVTSNWTLQIPFMWSIKHSRASQSSLHAPNVNLDSLSIHNKETLRCKIKQVNAYT